MKSTKTTEEPLLKKIGLLKAKIAKLEKSETERKQTEETLRESELKFRSVFENSPDIVALTDLKGTFLDINQVASGYKKKDVIGSGFTDYLTPEQKKLFRDTFKKALKTGKSQGYEVDITNTEGRTFNWYNRICPIKTGGKITQAVINCTDISERKQAEVAMKESELWNKEIFDGSRDAFFIVGPNTHFVDVNNAAASLTGYSKDELLKMTIPDLHEEKDLGAYNKFFKRIMGGESITSEARLLRKDGTKVDTEFSNKRILIGSVSYMHTIARNVTERKQAEEALKESEEQYRSIFNSSTDAIFVLDKKGRIVDANPEVFKIYGYSWEESLDLKPKKLIHKKHFHLFEKLMNDFPSSGKYELEAINLKKDGSPINVEIKVTSFYLKGEIHYLNIVRDITERKQAEEKLKNRNKELETMNNITVGRELKMIELKKEINKLLEKTGEKPKYKLPI